MVKEHFRPADGEAISGVERPTRLASDRRTHSCAECRRRRIRCDSKQAPCSQCLYYQVPERCYYPQRQIRRATTVKAYADLSNAYNINHRILERLFPGLSIEYLDTLSRDELIALLSSQPVTGSPDAGQTSGLESTEILSGFESSRAREFIWDESFDSESQQSPAGVDDVNGITALFDTDSGRSYLGISSVPAILHVMVSTSPSLRHAIQKKKMATDQEQTDLPMLDVPLSFSQGACPPRSQQQITDEATLIDAYFQSFHLILPMVNETDFRQCHALGGRTDLGRGPWLALLNMVLAFGYISCNDDSEPGHLYFSKRSLEHMNVSCFGVGHLYMLQALILFGGHYLHFLNKPNMGNAVLGAAHRMALAMGLHQETSLSKTNLVNSKRMAGVRSRTWWCLFCVDTWAGTTLGRPPSYDPGMASLNELSALYCGPLDYSAVSIKASASLSTISARIQRRTVETPFIPFIEVRQFDGELSNWHKNRHCVFRGDFEPHQALSLVALLVEYRYLNVRMLLHRPSLLVQCIKTSNLDNDITSFANTCCSIARQTVDVIERTWYPNQILAWNASWFLFQACLVLLLRLLSNSVSPVEEAQLEDDIARSLNLFTQMLPWRAAAGRGQDLVQFIFKSRHEGNGSSIPTWLILDDDILSLLGISNLMEESADGTS